MHLAHEERESWAQFKRTTHHTTFRARLCKTCGIRGTVAMKGRVFALSFRTYYPVPGERRMSASHLVRPVGLSALRVAEVRLEASPVGHVVERVRAEVPLANHVRRVPSVVHELWKQLEQRKERTYKGGGGRATPSGLITSLNAMSIPRCAVPRREDAWCAVGMDQ